jgi:hypothetical protein
MSKMSMPCIFPTSSRRSRPVACSTSVGMVPGFAPGGTRSSSLLISADGEEYQHKSATWIGLVVVVAAAIVSCHMMCPNARTPRFHATETKQQPLTSSRTLNGPQPYSTQAIYQQKRRPTIERAELGHVLDLVLRRLITCRKTLY